MFRWCEAFELVADTLITDCSATNNWFDDNWLGIESSLIMDSVVHAKIEYGTSLGGSNFEYESFAIWLVVPGEYGCWSAYTY